jgi:glycosyltransferase involved in cell wall biosynthesis
MEQWEGLATKTVRSVGVVKGPAGKTQPSFLHRILRRLAAFVRSCLYFPDYSVGWVPFALVRGIKLLRKHRFDVIFSSEPPRSASVVALLLRMTFRVPWVFELMDPWYPPPRPWRRRIERWFLGFMLRRADAVVVMTEGHRQDLHENFGISSSKFFVIPNGFDEADFGAESSALAGQTTEMCSPGFLHFSHFGTVYPRNAGQFFPGLNDLLRESPELRNRLRFHMVGFPDDSIRQYVLQENLQEVVEFRKFITSHAEALKEMHATHCLLLFWGDREFSRLAAAGKTYVYLRTSRPILAVTGPGTIAERIEAAQAGWVVNAEDPAAIKATLRTIIDLLDRKERLPSARPDYVAQFRWDRLASQMADVFDGVVNRGR